MIKRPNWIKAIDIALSRRKVVALVGPRQCGKTTLAREFLQETSPSYFDLEDPLSLARLDEPMTELTALSGLIVIDEVQLRPDLFPVLRVLVDRRGYGGRFLILGSASGELLRQSSESLAGRMETLALRGFSLKEVGVSKTNRHWLRGGLPPAYLADTEADSNNWRKTFIELLLTRDFPQWGVRVPAVALRRFWTMLAHFHGQVWNAAAPARALGVSESTMRRYLDLLTDAFMVRQLPAWHTNLRKRQVKAPKIYLRDTGLLHQLLGIRSERELLMHPKVGASWEGYAIEEVLDAVRPDEAYFWATHQGAEIDLVLRKDGHLFGVECKRADAPRMTPSLRIALEDLKLERIAVIYPGRKRYALAQNVEAVPLDVVPGGRLFDLED